MKMESVSRCNDHLKHSVSSRCSYLLPKLGSARTKYPETLRCCRVNTNGILIVRCGEIASPLHKSLECSMTKMSYIDLVDGSKDVADQSTATSFKQVVLALAHLTIPRRLGEFRTGAHDGNEKSDIASSVSKTAENSHDPTACYPLATRTIRMN